jgi:molybdopterin molybdotransferase
VASFGFSVRFLSWGVVDDPEKIAGEIAGRIDEVDILITTGGVSVGDRDFIPVVFEKLSAELLFRGMDFKPGSAVLCGMYRGKLLMCLSGNPFASLATFELLVKPVLARLAGRDDLATRRFQAVLKNDFPKASRDRRFIRARLEDSGAGGMDGGASGMDSGVYLPDGHSSEQLFSLVGCNCLADIPQGSPPLKAGSMVEIVLL